MLGKPHDIKIYVCIYLSLYKNSSLRLGKVGSLKKKNKTQPQTKNKSSSSFEGEHEDGNKKQHYILINTMQLTQD